VTTGFHLLDQPNPNGPFFYNSRRTCSHGVIASQLPHLAVVHTAEALPDYTGPDTSGESLAKYASTTFRSVSWHSTVDADGTIPMLPDSYVGFHVVNYNSCSVGVEIATQAGKWVELANAYPAWYGSIMAQAANQVAWWCKVHNLSPRRLTKAEADQGARGIIGHHALDPTRRTDPGAAFAWEVFIADIQLRLQAPSGYLDKGDWPTWATASIQKAINKGIMVGDGKLWQPSKTVTRAEIALILDRLGQLE
jgi:hypothetical protein